MTNRRCHIAQASGCLCDAVLLMLLFASASSRAFATDYVLMFTHRGSSYYLARSYSGSVTMSGSFNPANCIWHCENSSEQSASLGASGTWLFQESHGGRYYLKHGGTIETETAKNSAPAGGRSPNAQTWRVMDGYLYGGGGSAQGRLYIAFQNLTAASSASPHSDCARPVVVTRTNVAAHQVASTTTLTEPTINISSVRMNYADEQTFTASALATTTTVTRKAYTQYTIHANPQQHYYSYNNWRYTSLNSIPTQTSVTHPPIAYTWTLEGGANCYLTMSDDGASVSVTCGAPNATRTDAVSVLSVAVTAGDQTSQSVSNAVITVPPAAE